MKRTPCGPTAVAMLAASKRIPLSAVAALVLLAGCEGGRVMLPTTDVDTRAEDEAPCINPVGPADNTAMPDSTTAEEEA